MFNFQTFTSRISAFREISTVNLRVLPWSGGDMTPAPQYDRRGTTGRARNLTAVEEGEILQRACMQQAERHAVNAA
jgi:hypothetical protein